MTSADDNQPGLPPAAALLQMITGAWLTQAISVVATLGVADHLGDGSRTVEDLATRVGADAGALYRLLRALASVGVFTEVEPRAFGLTSMAECLRSDVPGSQRAFARLIGSDEWWRAWGELGHSVRTGQTAFEHVHGSPAFTYMGEHPGLGQLFQGAMTGFVSQTCAAVIAAYNFAPYTTVVDVGGGHGMLMGRILQASPQTKGVVFDLPQVAASANAILDELGVADRCECVGGDFFVSVPPGADAYLLTSIIHDWDDERSRAILENCREAMSPSGKVLLVEMVIPPGDTPFFGKILDLEMMVTPGGRERTADEFRALLSSAGLELTRIVPTESPSSIIEAVPA